MQFISTFNIDLYKIIASIYARGHSTLYSSHLKNCYLLTYIVLGAHMQPIYTHRSCFHKFMWTFLKWNMYAGSRCCCCCCCIEKAHFLLLHTQFIRAPWHQFHNQTTRARARKHIKRLDRARNIINCEYHLIAILCVYSRNWVVWPYIFFWNYACAKCIFCQMMSGIKACAIFLWL